MNRAILDQNVQQYIQTHLDADVTKIALSRSTFDGITAAELAGQIHARKKARKKLPTWFNTKLIYYPSPLSIEQTSSETTAHYKAKLVLGQSLVDITGGFGVDAYYFAKKAKAVTHCEINSELSEIAQYNARLLNVNNISFQNVDGLEYLGTTDLKFDTIYVDPARRAETGKVFMLKDCTPNVVSNLDKLLAISKRVIIKTAPLLDLSAGLGELKNVAEIQIVSVKNECKELLWILEKGFEGVTTINAVTLNDEEKHFSFKLNDLNTEVNFANKMQPEDFLYEPDAALLKSGAFNLIGKKYQIHKLHPQSQLYTSKQINTDFPGRIFEVKEIFSSREIKKHHALKGNVIVRNYPAKAEELVKKYKIIADKDEFLIFTKDISERNIIISAKILQYY